MALATIFRRQVTLNAKRGLTTMAPVSTSSMQATVPKAVDRKTVLVAGGSYAGHEAALVLSELLPPTHKVVLLERNSHFNHVYSFPRFSVLAGHEHKAFIPYKNVFGIQRDQSNAHHQFVQGTLSSVRLTKDGSGQAVYQNADDKGQESTLPFDYLVYALGSQRPGSIDLWASSAFTGSKLQGISGLQKTQVAIQKARDIVIVGAGPLGVEFAGDIADVHAAQLGAKEKSVTLISSRQGVLPRLNEEAQRQTSQWLTEHGVNVVLGQRLQGTPTEHDGRMVVATDKGGSFTADIVLDCRGLTPYTTPLKPILDRTTSQSDAAGWLGTRAAKQNRYLQLIGDASHDVFAKVYVAGDAGEAFGAHKDGKNAREQAGLVSRNIVRQIALDAQSTSQRDDVRTWADAFLKESGAALEEYWPVPLRIKVSLGLHDAIGQSQGKEWLQRGVGADDLNVLKHWVKRGLTVEDMHT